ncbi:DUF6082 family protein [Streptomyces sp. NPDC052225]|uniref:DUF6082 family protein n=1 Tax=Streptomyces sp. NPDC052225 TaxID=3154949 RepID=UPI003414EEFC
MATQSHGFARFVFAAATGGVAGALATTLLHMRHGTAHQEQLASQERRAARAHQQRMHWELLNKAIDDASLADVIDTYESEFPPEKRRQLIFANAWYVNALHLYQAGLMDRSEVYGHLREIFQSRVMREYWEATRYHRASLDDGSEEAWLGRITDGLIKELDEDDSGEWWVVGEPPID